MYRVCIAAIAVAMAFSARAATPDAAATQEDARKLVVLMKFDGQIDEARKQ